MKKILVIGSTVVDVIIQLPHLPKTQEDVHVITQKMSLGGCAYNTSDMIRHFGAPYILFSPVGTGAYGDFVRTELKKRGIVSPIPTPDRDNGCCYCFVENGGERTFVSYHGAEYLFEKEWFDLLDADSISSVYICGLEIEETTGVNIVAWLEAHPQFPVYFAPGPRINMISQELLERLFALHPILHLNEEEACTYAQNRALSAPQPDKAATESAEVGECCAAAAPLPESAKTGESLQSAAAYLHRLTGNTVIVTLGARGAYCCGSAYTGYVEGFPAKQTDTIGAGDSHIGAVMACRSLGKNLYDSVRTANYVAARVVETEGALLSDEAFRASCSSIIFTA